MMKRFIKIFIIILSLFLIVSCQTVAIPSENYDEEISKLEANILDLQNQNATLTLDVEESNRRNVEQLKAIEGHYTKDELYNWFNKCNIYATRSNVKICLTYGRNAFSTSKLYSSGVIVGEYGNTKYVLASYYSTYYQSKNYNYTSYTIYDAFETQYSARLINYSENYGLALILFTDNNSNDLNVIKLASTNIEVNDPVCNIFSLSSSTFNHMMFTVVDSILETNDYVNYPLYCNKVDVISSIYGAMSINIDGSLCGLVLLSSSSDNLVYSIDISVIKTFLDNCKISYSVK